MAKKEKHIHKYHKVNLGYVSVWACALPDCGHFMPKNTEALVLGRASLCWLCNERFILDPMNMKNDQPICYSCSDSSDEISEALRKRLELNGI